MSTALKNSITALTASRQDTPAFGRESQQVANSDGAYVFAADDFARLRRFLVLGTEGGSFYAGEKQLTEENAKVVLRCLGEDGKATVDEIVAISKEGRAPKNDQAIFALALATSHGDEDTRRYALDRLPEVARIGTHLFQFCDYVDGLRGWGRALRRAVGAWYEGRDADGLAYQLVKYRQREGWTHRDVLRLAHPEGDDRGHDVLYRWVRKGTTDTDVLPDAIVAFERAQKAETVAETVALIREYGGRLPREALRTEHQGTKEVWEALVAADMPIGAMVRNLANMSHLGALEIGSDTEAMVISKLGNEDAVRRSRLHPMAILIALYTYRHGRSLRGDNTWAPNARIVNALDGAFYLAFGNVEPTGKRRLIALDVSGSMNWGPAQGGAWAGGHAGLTARDAAAAMSLVTLSTGDPCEVVAFASADHAARYPGDRWSAQLGPSKVDGIASIPISSRQRLDDVVRTIKALPASATDISLPMRWAQAEGKQFDSIEVYTDNETNAYGRVQPFQALRDYRRASGRDTRLVVAAMTSNGFTVADPDDPGMLDVVGLDSAAPGIIADFVAGRI